MYKIFNLFNLSQKLDYKSEVLSGLTVAMALIPEAVAFSLIAGLSPLTGLYAAFIMGIITAIFGGRPGMISFEIIIDFVESRVVDMSAIEALNKITEKYHQAGKKVQLTHLSKDCMKLLNNANKIITVNVVEDPTYKLVTDELS